MTPTARLHFVYIVSILVCIIVGLLTLKLADNSQVVSYLSFALTLASILLAVVATVYAFISNASLSESVGGLHKAAADVRLGAASLDRIASDLQQKVGTVTEKVAATHDLVRNMSNPSANSVPEKAAQATGVQASTGDPIDGMAMRSSGSGISAMYAAALAYTTSQPFNRDKLFSLLGRGNEDYYWGWLMALDAAQIIKIDDGPDATWKISEFPESLLKQVFEAAKAAPDVEEGDPQLAWNRRKVNEIDTYFSAGAA